MALFDDRRGDLKLMASWTDIIRKLAADRAHHQSEIERIDRLMRSVRELQELLPGQTVPLEVADSVNLPTLDASASIDVAEDAVTSPRGAQRQRNLLPPVEIAKFARETLLAVGRPMTRGQLVRAMEDRGLPLSGSDKAKNLGTILWRHKAQFVNLEKLGYWPSDEELPGVYKPNAS